MNNVTLFIIAFLSIAAVMLANEASNFNDKQPDYQAYTKERILEETK